MKSWAFLLSMLLFAQTRGPASSNPSFEGKWIWNGVAGWQRITLDLRTNGERVTGTLTMGPGRLPTDRSGEDWEHFFEPTAFAISDGVLKEKTVSFAQVLPGAPSGTQMGVRSSGSRAPSTKRERWVYSGTVDGERLVLTREIPARIDDPFALGYHKSTFVMTRNAVPAPIALNETLRSSASVNLPPLRSIDVAVRDLGGKPVMDLATEDFIITDNGAPRTISRLAPPETSANVLLMFDHNLTWLQDERNPAKSVVEAWNPVFVSSMKFLNALRPQDRFAVGIFEDKPVLSSQWRRISEGSTTIAMAKAIDPPDGQKNLYGAIEWTVTQFAGSVGRKLAVFFTDGRDGRLAPRWLRDDKNREALDPLFGVEDAGEQDEFEKTLSALAQSGIRFYFIAVNTDQDPEFGPAIIARRISGLYPGTSDGIAAYLGRARSRLERLAKVTGGRVLYGNTRQDAVSLYSDLHDELAIDRTYTIELAPQSLSGSLDVEVRRPGVRVTRLQRENNVR